VYGELERRVRPMPHRPYRSATMVVVIAAIMPRMFVVVPMLVVIIVAFARRNHTGRREHDHPKQDAAFDQGQSVLSVLHGYSNR
jgi:hypothetical protein